MSSGDRIYCSDLAREEREPLAGTASHALGCVVVSYPKRLWGRDALESEGLPEPMKLEVTRLREEQDVITRFVASEGEWKDRADVLFFPLGRRFDGVALEDVAPLLARARRGELGETGEPIRKPLVLVCTHGQRDRCCARFGLALTEELRRVATSDAIDVEVREASHLGGDRFAPTVLVLPTGHMYGHLEPSDASALLAAVTGGPALGPRFRGSLWLEPAAQLAEVAAFALPEFRDVMPTLGPIEVTDTAPDRRVLRATVSGGGRSLDLTVRCALTHRRVFGDCRNAERNRRGGVDVWVIEEVSTKAV